jgi:hypothetical protein
VVNVFFLLPFGQHNVPTKGVFFCFVPQMADIFPYPEYKRKKKMEKKENTGRFFSDHIYMSVFV